MPYWERFIETFPTISDLANAKEDQVLRLWQGLGYYSRARNLHATAKHIAVELKGIFPNTYSEILDLKGVGPYTAAALASICYDEPKPVVDGNVFRFASRYFGIREDISKAKSRKVFEEILSNEISKTAPGTFNQAMMEYGATICTPKAQCSNCEFHSDCFAYQNDLQKSLPLKTGKTKVRERRFHYLVFKSGNNFLLNQRIDKDVWGGLFDFFLLEGDHSIENILEKTSESFQMDCPILDEVTGPMKHILSHQKISASFYQIIISDKDRSNVLENSSLNSYSIEEMLNLPKPKLIVNYLHKVGIK